MPDSDSRIDQEAARLRSESRRGFEREKRSVMSKDEIIKSAVAELEELRASADLATLHRLADRVLCRALLELGCDRIVDVYDAIPRWFAAPLDRDES